MVGNHIQIGRKGVNGMDIQTILQAITTVGFPIVCCGAMMWYVKYSTDKNRDDLNALNEMHRAEMLEMTEAVNNNTVVLNRLCEILKQEGE